MDRNVEAAIATVPADLIKDPGLVYERIRWRRKKGFDLEARQLIFDFPLDQVRPDLWLSERNALARDALQQGHVSEAYRLARGHALTDPGGYAEAEWLAGWIALRFLHEPEVARAHFLAMFAAVRYPISLARAAYWSARACAAAGDQKLAAAWYRAAATYPLTFYGHLAAEHADGLRRFPLPQVPEPTAAEQVDFARHELVRAVRLLANYVQTRSVPPFIRRLAEINPRQGWQVLVVRLAAEAGRPDLGVDTAKRAIRNGFPLLDLAYPIIAVPTPGDSLPHPVDPLLLLAMVRQESVFELEAVSSAGARGLMQLMPNTARHVAASLNLPFSVQRLVADADYNLRLGQAYLSNLLKTFEGSYVLAFAAYNAGPSRVRDWIREYGDPREGMADAIDWIEILPLAETRNYVQRAMENLWVYRALLNSGTVVVAKDLTR
jgi:soluble lytic murein transglycosylase